jgi:prolyl-tRNA editing enzyme YbaK/EbsC (Cys-tRNA(Pro) deacylase)
VTAPLPPSAERVRESLAALGIDARVVLLDRSARTAADAAAALGCRVEQIAKSLVFRLTRAGTALLVVASGGNRVDEARVAALVGEPIEKADADFVREQTGFAIGGVPPAGHPRSLPTLVDEDLLGGDDVWAAAGHPRTVVRLTGAELCKITSGRVVAVK